MERKLILQLILLMFLGMGYTSAAQNLHKVYSSNIESNFPYKIIKLSNGFAEINWLTGADNYYDKTEIILRDSNFDERGRTIFPFVIRKSHFVNGVLLCIANAGTESVYDRFSSIGVVLNEDLSTVIEKEIQLPNEELYLSYGPGLLFDENEGTLTYTAYKFDVQSKTTMEESFLIKLNSDFEVEAFKNDSLFGLTFDLFDSEYGFILSSEDSIYGLDENFTRRWSYKQLKEDAKQSSQFNYWVKYDYPLHIREDSSNVLEIRHAFVDSVNFSSGRPETFRRKEYVSFHRTNNGTLLSKDELRTGLNPQNSSAFREAYVLNDYLYFFGATNSLTGLSVDNDYILFKVKFNENLSYEWSNIFGTGTLNYSSPITIYVSNDRKDIFCIYGGDTQYKNYHFKDQVTTIREITSENVALYPNPAENYLFINSRELITNMVITDLNGSIKVRQSDVKHNRINIESIESGLYLIKLEFEDGIERVTRFIKQ